MKSNPDKTILTIVLGFGVLFLIFGQLFFLYTAIVLVVIGVFSPFLSLRIEWIWFGIAKILGAIIPKVLLSMVFFLVLFPISLMRKWVTGKDPLMIRKKQKSTFRAVNRTFQAQDLENPW